MCANLKKNSRTVFPHNSGGWKSKIKMSTYLGSPEVPLRGLADSCLPAVGSHGLFSLCEPVCCLILDSPKDTSHVGLD